MELAKRSLVLLAALLMCLTGITTAAPRMVIGEMITNTS
jgi:hypothetical protein